MAKKKTKASRSSAADAVRSAVDQAFGSGQVPFSRERAFELVDDLSQVAGRLRDALEDLRPNPAEESDALARRVQELEARVASLEAAEAKRTTSARRPAARKPAARPATAKASTAKPAGASKPAAARSAAKTSAAAKKPAAPKKPAATRAPARRRPPATEA